MSKFSLISARFGLLQPNKACRGADICTVVSLERFLYIYLFFIIEKWDKLISK